MLFYESQSDAYYSHFNAVHGNDLYSGIYCNPSGKSDNPDISAIRLENFTVVEF